MRPRVFPAEDEHTTFLHSISMTASMRPRVFPAEDSVVICGSQTAPSLQ